MHVGTRCDSGRRGRRVLLLATCTALLVASIGSAAAAAPGQDPPTIAIGDATVAEGDAGTVGAVFQVTLSEVSGDTVTVDYATSDGTATAGEDYEAAGGTISIDPGKLSDTVEVQVDGDLVDESDETFFVDLSNPVNASIDDGQGLGTITDDDTAPVIDSFTPGKGKVTAAVTVFGSAFTGATAVDFGGVGASFTIVSDSQIDARVPFGASTGPISVTSPAGSGTSASDFLVPPRIRGFTPANGPVGTQVLIAGQAFLDVTVVTFRGVSATFSIDSWGQITAVVPAGATTGPIRVFNSGGRAKSKTNFVVT